MQAKGRVLLGILASCVSLWAQGSTAQIAGTVRDASGLAVPDAAVKATQTATGAVRTVSTGVDGGYVLPELPIGPWLIQISKEGFSRYVQSGIILQVDSNPTIDATLKVGSATEQVTVQADANLVETHSTGVGTVVDNQRVVELPLNGRNPTELVFLAGMANLAPASATGSINSVRNYPTVVIQIGGGQANGTTYLLDGANHNDPANNLNLPLPFPDALQEFKVETSALPAQYGYHSAAAVNAVTKSGTNGIHGDAFEFVRNGDFNARDFFATARDTLKRNQFGGVIGGPIRRDKLFFFLGWQDTIQKSTPPQTVAYVPTQAMLNGDFSTIAGPACNNGKTINLPASLGFTDNMISPALFNHAALLVDQRLPISTDPCGKVTFGLLANPTENLGVARIDYQKSFKQSIFGRATVSNLDQPTTYDGHDALTLNQNGMHDRIYALAVGDTYLIGSSIVSSFRASVNRTEIPKIVDDFATWQQLGVNANSFQAPNPRISVTGNGFAIGSGSTIVSLPFAGPDPNFSEDVSVVKGSHQLGFGGMYIHTLMNLTSGINATGVATFNGSVSGMPLADFLLGDASGWAQGTPNGFQYRQNYFGIYAEDSWKATPRLTINYGVRWEPYLAITSKHGCFNRFLMQNFLSGTQSQVYVNAPAGEIFPGDTQWTSGNGIHNAVWDKFAPRFGLVWDPTGTGKTTIRAAYGMFNDRMNIYSLVTIGQTAPFGNVVTLGNVNFSNPWATYPGGVSPFPATVTKNFVFPTYAGYADQPQDLKPTYIHQWNLSIQHQLGQDWLISANYLGDSTIHFLASDDINPAVFLGTGPCTIPGPNGKVTNYSVCSTTANTNQRRRLYLQNPDLGQYYGVIATQDDGGTGEYEAIFFSAQKRLSHGTTLIANYTFSHCISDLWNVFVGNGGASALTPGNRRNDRSNCQQGDQRQVFNLSAVAQTPRFSNSIARLLASKWQFSPIMNIKSAQFFTVTSGIDVALNGEGSQRPNLVNPGGIYPANQSVTNWLSRPAFGTPAPGVIGNLGNYNLSGPGVFQLDMALSRTFVLRERQTLQVRGEAFNLPNRLNPAVPVTEQRGVRTNPIGYQRHQRPYGGRSAHCPIGVEVRFLSRFEGQSCQGRAAATSCMQQASRRKIRDMAGRVACPKT